MHSSPSSWPYWFLLTVSTRSRPCSNSSSAKQRKRQRCPLLGSERSSGVQAFRSCGSSVAANDTQNSQFEKEAARCSVSVQTPPHSYLILLQLLNSCNSSPP